MKVKLNAEHWGLAELMYGVLGNHDVRIPNITRFPPQYDFKECEGDEEIVISTFSYIDLKDEKGEKPVIIYATDPVYYKVWDDFIRVQKETWSKVVVAEDCYPREFFPVLPNFTIPYAVDPTKYAEYTGEINRVAVVNRKPHARWLECVRGATGVAYTLEEFLGDIPFDIFEIPNNEEYRNTLGKYKVMFYFSNSPYSIVMFEGMTIGMPMVAFNHHHASTYKPTEKYLYDYGSTKIEIQSLLRKYLDNPPQKVSYPIPLFEEIKRKWDLVLEETLKCAK